jgi:hypothetical protein
VQAESVVRTARLGIVVSPGTTIQFDDLRTSVAYGPKVASAGTVYQDVISLGLGILPRPDADPVAAVALGISRKKVNPSRLPLATFSKRDGHA